MGACAARGPARTGFRYERGIRRVCYDWEEHPPPGASGPSEAQASDTLAHVTIDPTDPPSHPPGIWLYDWYPRKPMGYMVFIRNSRPHPAQIIGYEIKVKSEDLAFVQQVSWPTIDGIASNGFPALLSHLDGWPDRPPLGSRPRAIGPIPLPADQRISLIIPVDISDIARAHTDNPRWSAEGWFHLRCGASEEIVDFHDPLGRYQLSEEDWAKARTAFAPR